MNEVNAMSIIPLAVNNILNYSDESSGVKHLLEDFIVEDVKEEIMHEELFDDTEFDLKFTPSEDSEIPVAEYEDKAPRNLPKGVRAYPTITAFGMPMTKAVSNMNGVILSPDNSVVFNIKIVKITIE